jgi:hypothetical protein
MPRRREPPPFGEYRIICPYCKFQNPQVTRDDYNVFQCPSCYGDFRVFIAKVRAKRGRSDGYREYMIRTVTHSGESVLRFRDFGCSDLDLRSGDIFYVCHKKDENGIFESEPSINTLRLYILNLLNRLRLVVSLPQSLVATILQK